MRSNDRRHCLQNCVQICQKTGTVISSYAVGSCVKKSTLPKISLINARSLLPKFDELSASLSINPVDIMAITETWFNEDIEDDLVSIYSYNLFRKDRLNRRGGGVCIYLSKFFHAKCRTDPESDNFE